jgi:cell division septation protein DedD
VTIVRAAPAPVAQQQRTVKVNGCEGASPVSNKYFNTNGLPGRCGPQAVPHVTVVSKGGSGRSSVVTDVNGQAYGQYAPANTVPGNARVLPRHVYETRDNAVPGQVPAGYTRAWSDGRLNPYRANQTLNGRDQMLLVWTNTVPRRLINKRTGQDVSAYHPKLIFPFTNYDSQNAYLSSQSRTQTKASVTPRVSSKSAPSRPAQAAIKGTFVQVGMYGNEANARNAVARLRNAGLPVKYGLTKRNGKQYRAVLAGPFTSRQTLNQALGSARRIGFSDAFIR